MTLASTYKIYVYIFVYMILFLLNLLLPTTTSRIVVTSTRYYTPSQQKMTVFNSGISLYVIEGL